MTTKKPDNGFREKVNSSDSKIAKVSDDNNNERFVNPSALYHDEVDQSFPRSPKFENRKVKSLALLTQNFVKLFLCTNVKLSMSNVRLTGSVPRRVMLMLGVTKKRLFTIGKVLPQLIGLSITIKVQDPSLTGISRMRYLCAA